MALVTIPDKSTGDSFSAAEMNQILDAIKDGTLDIKTALLTLTGNVINIATQKTPSSAADTGTKGDICHDTAYIYVCVNTDEWERVAIASW